MLAERDGLDGRAVVRRIAATMAFVAATLAVASVLHLSGVARGRSEPFDADHAGVAEAIIGVVLMFGAVALARAPARSRAIGIATIGFAILGFVVGLNFTVRGGHAPDVAYHILVLPVLIATLIVLLRAGRPFRHRDRDLQS
jgi:peptidoglycan/LPS O-acetylase OafA/YrhL